MYVCMYGYTYSKSIGQPGKVANPARGQLKNREHKYFPVRVFVSRDGFGSSVPLLPVHLHTQAESDSYLLRIVVVVDDDSHVQRRIVLTTEETTVTQQVSHRPIKCQSACCGHIEVQRSTGHIMVTTRYSEHQFSKSRQKVILSV